MINDRYYQVIITGITIGNSPQNVIANLGDLFKTDPSKFQALLKGVDIIVKKRVDQKKASVYKSALEKTGCTVSIKPLIKESTDLLSNKHPEKKPQNIKCPNCNYTRSAIIDIRPDTRCPICNIIYAEFVEKQNHKSENATLGQAKNTTPLNKVNYQRKDSLEKKQQKTGVSIKTGFFPLAFLLYLCTPCIEIDGVVHKVRWGTHFFPLTPGRHVIKIYIYYLLTRTGTNSIDIVVEEGVTDKIKYWMPPLIILKGSIKKEIKHASDTKGNLQQRMTNFWLVIAIFIAPYIFVWVTLGKGYSKKTKIISFVWLVFFLLILLLGQGSN